MVVIVKSLEALIITLNKNIKKDKFKTVFKACSETTKNKTDKVNKIKLLELLVEEVAKIGLFTVSII